MLRLSSHVAMFLVVSAMAIIPARAADSVSTIHDAISGYVIPNFERFSGTAHLLVDDMEQLCKSPSPVTLDGARGAFGYAVEGLGRVYFLRIGPMEAENRRDRLLFWPDRRSIALKRVQRTLAERDQSVTNPDELAGKSVALQGFGALEFLLFGTGSEALAGEAGQYRCEFALAVAKNIAVLADDIFDAWQSKNGFAEIWMHPGPDNNLFRNPAEALTTLVGLLSNGLEALRDQVLKPIAPFGTETKPYKRALFWRSNQTRPFVLSTMMGMRDLVQISGLLKELPAEFQWLAGSMEFEFNNAFNTLSELDQPIETVVNTQALASKLSYLVVVTRSLQNLLGEQTAFALDLPTTFSPLDGD